MMTSCWVGHCYLAVVDAVSCLVEVEVEDCDCDCLDSLKVVREVRLRRLLEGGTVMVFVFEVVKS